MNDEHRQMLRQGLDNLIAAQSEVMEARDRGKGDYQVRGEAIERREKVREGIMDFVKSLVEDVDDPRANLRPCYVHDCGEAFFHSWYTDADGEPSAIVEYPDGNVNVCMAWHVRFTDVPETEET